MTSLRPSDANETVSTWKIVIEYKTGPVALLLTRQKLPTIDRTKYPSADNLVKGAYVLIENSSTPDLILIGTGSEVQLALGAYDQLVKEGIKARVVSMPSWELFERSIERISRFRFPSKYQKTHRNRSSYYDGLGKICRRQWKNHWDEIVRHICTGGCYIQAFRIYRRERSENSEGNFVVLFRPSIVPLIPVKYAGRIKRVRGTKLMLHKFAIIK